MVVEGSHVYIVSRLPAGSFESLGELMTHGITASISSNPTEVCSRWIAKPRWPHRSNGRGSCPL